MAEAETLTSLSPKELGRHLREVRRRKGLSLSEVARGAGLTRRELNSYEKGRIPIPESDLFVIAGSCGVEVSELRAPRSTPELATGDTPTAESEPEAAPAAPLPVPSTIEDTVAQLRRSQEVAAPSVPAVSGRRRPRALGAGDASPPPPEPANEDWSIERIDPLEAVQWPSDASISAPAAYGDPSPAEPIDVFEELARLGEPMTAASDAVEEFEIAAPDTAVEPVEWPVFDDADPEPVVVEMPAAPEELDFLASAADAPPIDVAARAESFASPWDALRGDDPAPAWSETLASPSNTSDLSFAEREDAEWNDAEAEAWDAPDDTVAAYDTFDTIDSYGEKPLYEWAATDDNVVTPAYDWGTTDDGAETPAHEWDDTAVTAEPTEAFDPRFAAVAPWPEPEPEVPQVVSPTETVPWTHEPDPEATSTGFYVDWGDPTADALGAGPDPALADFGPDPEPTTVTWAEPEPAADTAPWTEPDAQPEAEPEPEPVDATWETPFVWDEPAPATETEPAPAEDGDDLPVISWRPQWEDAPLVPAAETAAVAVALDEWPNPWAEAEPDPERERGAEPVPEEHFVVAGAEWELGNAVPLVEVRSTGSLVMRRADERWALADVTAPPDFALEAYVDLRSGPGFGVLFRAEVDTDGRMSGYSFDIDPVYEGGGYLVREWRADRELWNPIAHVGATDPEAMHGLLAVRVTVDDDRLVASVNGTTVLTVESLKEASAERGRDGACGNRVGIQAWSSTDLVIDELRVAEH